MHKGKPFNNVETRHSILSSDSIQKSTQHSDTHAGSASAGGGNVAAPLVGFRIISAQVEIKRWFKENCIPSFINLNNSILGDRLVKRA